MLTRSELEKAEFKGPVAFYDGTKGMARQDFQCIAEPRLGYFWQRQNRQDKGRQAYMVDGREVADLDEAAALLALPPAADSPDVLRKLSIDEFKASPRVNGPFRALSEARANADGGPFQMVRAWLQRAGGLWHGAINRHSDDEREAGREWPRWFYDVNNAAHETYHGVYLFTADRKEDTGLKCAMGVKCRACPILRRVEETMATDASRPFPKGIEEMDIDAAKAWTCIGHILTSGTHPMDGAFWARPGDGEF